jgi:hypothetical protein
VHHAALVGGDERLGTLHGDVEKFLQREGAALLALALAQSFALDELHHQEGVVVLFDHVIDGGDVGDIDARDVAGFLAEPAAIEPVPAQTGGKAFERDHLLQVSVFGAIHLSHGAPAQAFFDEIPRGDEGSAEGIILRGRLRN